MTPANTPKRHRRIGRLFDEVLEHPPEERASFLERACSGDAGLRADVERLLAHHLEAEEFLSQPAMQVAASLLAQNAAISTAGGWIGRYQLVSLLGVGGMGEVWLARDPQLERKVALKLLLEQFTRVQSHVRRFIQEAKAASALSHPNIITIHEVGEDDGKRYIVAEFVDGQTLRQMLNGPLPAQEALDIALQIADALIAAHQAGIVHRDLKPENVMVRPDGLVKVLDFGLAKLADRTEPGAETPSVKINTDPGMIMGTISYMSPEQALAQPLDQRTDIFSFGVMLYEMLNGLRPFQGASNAAIYDAILHQDPIPATASRPEPPREWQWILERALGKKPEQRFQTAAEFKAALKSLKERSDARAVSSAPAIARPGRNGWVPKAIIGAGVVIALATAGYWRWFGERSGAALALKSANFTQLTRTPGQEIYPSLSPDGKYLVYASDEDGDMDIYLQRVSGATPINLTRDSAADDSQPAFSPDGEQIVFRSEREGGGVFVMGATGENVRRLIDHGHNPAWSPDGREIAFSDGSFIRPSERGNYPSPLSVYLLAGGETRRVTETDAVQPNWSPTGRRIAFWGVKGGGQRDIWTVSAQGGEPVTVTDDAALDWNPIWSPDGHYLYFVSDRGGSMNLWRVPIEEASGKLLGEFEPVTTPATNSGYVSFSRDGRRLVYAQIDNKINLQQVSFDPAKSKIEAPPVWITQGSRIATDPCLSPDGEWLVFGETGDDQEDLFMIRTDGTDLRQLTNDKYKDRAPRWSPNGRRILFFSDRSGRYEYWMINPDGGGLEQFSYTSGPGAQRAVWSPDGLRLLCNFQTGPSLILDAAAPWRQQSPLSLPAVGAPAGLMMCSWSADGEKLAGQSNDGVYKYSFDSQRYDRLTEFGQHPAWLNDGLRLLYSHQDKLYLLDSRSRKTQQLLSVAPNRIQSIGVSRDNRLIYFSVKVNEADIWLASLNAALSR